MTVEDGSEPKVVDAEAAAAAEEMLEDGEIGDERKTPSADGAAQQPPCYDKTKSFFDSISCEAIERSRG